jgi:hypothetical protein
MSDPTRPDDRNPQDTNPQDHNLDDLSQAEAIAILRHSIRQLDQALIQITRPMPAIPSKAILENLVNTTQLLANELSIPLSSQTDAFVNEETPFGDSSLGDLPSPELDESPTGLDQVLPDLDRLDNWWDRLLGRIRRILPRAIAEKLSDWALTSILTGLLVISLVTSVWLLPRSPSEMKELPPLERSQQSQPSQLPQASRPLPSPATPAEPEVFTNPPELFAPDVPETIPVDPAQPKYTPEQSLIAAIGQEISSLSQRDNSALIASIEPDFVKSQLIVTVDDAWYQLQLDRQEKLSNEVWTRSQTLNFRKLVIRDRQGRVVARNSVVGNAIVILR